VHMHPEEFLTVDLVRDDEYYEFGIGLHHANIRSMINIRKISCF
jgi:hypothetical protein